MKHALECLINELETIDTEATSHRDQNIMMCMRCIGDIDLAEEKYNAQAERELLHKVKSILAPKSINSIDIYVK